MTENQFATTYHTWTTTQNQTTLINLINLIDTTPPTPDLLRQLYQHYLAAPPAQGRPALITTNGSTGRPRTTRVGPNGRTLIPTLENKLRRTAQDSCLITVDDPWWDSEETGRINKPTPNTKTDHRIACDLNHDREWFHQQLNQLATNRPLELLIQPWSAIRLFSGPQGKETAKFLTNNKITVVNIDQTLAYPTHELTVNDQMIDWTTGLAYRTCPAGFKHLYPTTWWEDHRAYNLLNLADRTGHQPTDKLTISNVTSCKCGNYRTEFTHTPPNQPQNHHELTKVWRNLTSHHESLQLWTDQTTAKLAYTGDRPDPETIHNIRALLSKHQTLTLHPNQHYKQGTRKRPHLRHTLTKPNWRSRPPKIEQRPDHKYSNNQEQQP